MVPSPDHDTPSIKVSWHQHVTTFFEALVMKESRLLRVGRFLPGPATPDGGRLCAT